MARDPEVRIEINEDALMRAVQPQVDKLQEQVNDTLHATLREVREEMGGLPVDEVYDELVSRLRERIKGVQLKPEVLRRYAVAISEGTLSD